MRHVNRSVRACVLGAAFLFTLALAACSGGGGGGQPDSGTVGQGDSGAEQPLDEAVRLATVAAADPVYRANLDKPKEQRDAALVAFFRQQPTIEAAGISPSNNVWARFTDGTSFTLLDNGGPPPATTPRRAGMTEGEASSSSLQLPGGVNAISAYSLEPGWRNLTGEIGGWLADAGYTVRTGGLTVDDLENMSDISVLFWQTHSGMSQLRPDAGPAQPDGGPPVGFAFMTSTASSANPPALLKSLRDDGSLGLSGTSPTDLRYAITEKYIRDRLRTKFAKAALVAIDSCTGAAAEAAWAAAGVGHFVAWSDLSGNVAYLAFEKYFDRLLGMNAASPLSTPKERPFPAQMVELWMQRAGHDRDLSVWADNGVAHVSTAQLRFLHHPENGDFVGLRPTILRAYNTSTSADRVFRFGLDGTFGDDPGPANRRVTLGGTQLEVTEWNSAFVLVKVPSPIPSGSFEVEIGPRKSTPARFTEWVVPFTYSFVGQETLQYELRWNCRLRADVRGFRVLPQDVPVWTVMGTWALKDSGGSFSVSGQLHDNQGKLLEQWTGGGQLPWYDPAVGPVSNYVTCGGGIYPSSSTFQLGLAATGDFSRAPASGKGTAVLDGILPPTVLSVDWQTMTIQAGSVDVTTQLSNHGVSARLFWPTVAPTNLPTDDDPR